MCGRASLLLLAAAVFFLRAPLAHGAQTCEGSSQCVDAPPEGRGQCVTRDKGFSFHCEYRCAQAPTPTPCADVPALIWVSLAYLLVTLLLTGLAILLMRAGDATSSDLPGEAAPSRFCNRALASFLAIHCLLAAGRLFSRDAGLADLSAIVEPIPPLLAALVGFDLWFRLVGLMIPTTWFWPSDPGRRASLLATAVGVSVGAYWDFRWAAYCGAAAVDLRYAGCAALSAGALYLPLHVWPWRLPANVHEYAPGDDRQPHVGLRTALEMFPFGLVGIGLGALFPTECAPTVGRLAIWSFSYCFVFVAATPIHRALSACDPIAFRLALVGEVRLLRHLVENERAGLL